MKLSEKIKQRRTDRLYEWSMDELYADVAKLENENAELAKENRHAVINFVDFCIEKEGLDKQGMEITYMHFIKSKGGAK